MSLNFIKVPENFLLADVKVEDDEKVVARHIIYATPSQVNLLRQASTWFMDGTFKVVREPYVQLFGIHAFVICDENIKQVPLVNVLMSRRQKVDYNAVFKELSSAMDRNMALEEAVVDFEVGTWTALLDVFPYIDIFGCHFHYTNAIYKKAQKLGLSDK